MGNVSGKVALVTGGGRGIGAATALELAHRGADVAVVARSSGEVNAVAREIEGPGRRALPLLSAPTSQSPMRRRRL
jgi:7-alpha-hydroxysteroid dehydrogenase